MSYLLNEVGHMVKAILHNNWFLSLNGFPFILSLSPLQKPLLLGSLVLRAVLQKHLKQVGCCKHTSTDIVNYIFYSEK